MVLINKKITFIPNKLLNFKMALICRMLTNNENSFISTYYGNIYSYSIDYNPNLKNNSPPAQHTHRSLV